MSNAAYLAFEDQPPQEKPLINLTVGALYKAVLEGGWYRVWDDFGEDYLYPVRMFEGVADAGPAW